MSREEPSTHSEVGFNLSEQIRGKPLKNGEKFLYAWFHVRWGARSRAVVKGKGGGAKISWRTKFEGGVARSRRDPAITMVADSAPTLSEQIHAKPSRICWTPSSTCDGDGVAGRCERKGRSRANLAEDTIRGRDCKFPPRSNYSWGQMLGQPLKS